MSAYRACCQRAGLAGVAILIISMSIGLLGADYCHAENYRTKFAELFRPWAIATKTPPPKTKLPASREVGNPLNDSANIPTSGRRGGDKPRQQVPPPPPAPRLLSADVEVGTRSASTASAVVAAQDSARENALFATQLRTFLTNDLPNAQRASLGIAIHKADQKAATATTLAQKSAAGKKALENGQRNLKKQVDDRVARESQRNKKTAADKKAIAESRAAASKKLEKKSAEDKKLAKGRAFKQKGARSTNDKYLADNWHKGTFPNRSNSMLYHLAKHGKGRTANEYTRVAMDFFRKNRQLGQKVILKDGTAGIKIQTKATIPGQKPRNIGGYWTVNGKLVTYWD